MENWKIRKLGPAEHYAIETDDGEMIASTAVGANTKNNALLIASAPKMRTALELAYAWLDKGTDTTVRRVVAEALGK